LSLLKKLSIAQYAHEINKQNRKNQQQYTKQLFKQFSNSITVYVIIILLRKRHLSSRLSPHCNKIQQSQTVRKQCDPYTLINFICSRTLLRASSAYGIANPSVCNVRASYSGV